MVVDDPTNRPKGMAAGVQCSPGKLLLRLLQPWWAQRHISDDPVPRLVGQCSHPGYGFHQLQLGCWRRPLGTRADRQQGIGHRNHHPPSLVESGRPLINFHSLKCLIYVTSCTFFFLVTHLQFFVGLSIHSGWFIVSRMRAIH